MEPRAFTVDADDILRVLKTPCGIFPAFNPFDKDATPTQGKEYIAIWDTGATSSVITNRVARELNLKPFTFIPVNHAGGTSLDVPAYKINVRLPNGVGISEINVSEGKITGADVLIGMDIITKGDFAISHVNGKTKFTFRIPSVEAIDFVGNTKPTMDNNLHSTKKVGRNDPCPCGSGKKYKKCCGINKS